jgi:phosphohistidine phosphatase
MPDRVLCSTARRARETWQLAETGLGATPPVTFEDRVYQASAAGLLDLIRRTPSEARTLVLVGHDPAVQELVLMLARTAPDPASGPAAGAMPPGVLDRIRAKFPTAAIAILEFAGTWAQLGPGRARLTGFVTPRTIAQGKPGSQSP